MTTKWKLLAAAVAVAMSGLTASAQASCAQVKDHDQRQPCRAEEGSQSASCATIKDHDERQLCRARSR